MRFCAYAEGYDARPFDVDDAEDAAEKMAEFVFDAKSGDTPRDDYDVTVMDPDGDVTRHTVILEFSPTFSVWEHPEEPADSAVAVLREAQGLDSHTEVTP